MIRGYLWKYLSYSDQQKLKQNVRQFTLSWHIFNPDEKVGDCDGRDRVVCLIVCLSKTLDIAGTRTRILMKHGPSYF